VTVVIHCSIHLFYPSVSNQYVSQNMSGKTSLITFQCPSASSRCHSASGFLKSVSSHLSFSSLATGDESPVIRTKSTSRSGREDRMCCRRYEFRKSDSTGGRKERGREDTPQKKTMFMNSFWYCSSVNSWRASWNTRHSPKVSRSVCKIA